LQNAGELIAMIVSTIEENFELTPKTKKESKRPSYTVLQLKP
jgi:hypothetical protein